LRVARDPSSVTRAQKDTEIDKVSAAGPIDSSQKAMTEVSVVPATLADAPSAVATAVATSARITEASTAATTTAAARAAAAVSSVGVAAAAAHESISAQSNQFGNETANIATSARVKSDSRSHIEVREHEIVPPPNSTPSTVSE